MELAQSYSYPLNSLLSSQEYPKLIKLFQEENEEFQVLAY